MQNLLEQERDIEKLSAEIHKLYCEQYLKNYNRLYWTRGNYSLLDEKTKEYDRNIARWHLSELTSSNLSIAREIVKRVREGIGELEDMRDSRVNSDTHRHWLEGINQERNRLRTLLDKIDNELK